MGRRPQTCHVEDNQTSGIANHTIASPTISFLTFASEEVTFPNVSSHPPPPCSPPHVGRELKSQFKQYLKYHTQATLRANIPETTRYWGEAY